MIQSVITLAIIIGAIAYTLYSLYKVIFIRKKETGCNGCCCSDNNIRKLKHI
jgi:hypothetical protein